MPTNMKSGETFSGVQTVATKRPALVKPTINLNGTAASDLLDCYIEAMNAVRAATVAVARTCPNGRDYQTVHPDNLRHALLQHNQRIQKLHALREELEALAEHASDHVR